MAKGKAPKQYDTPIAMGETLEELPSQGGRSNSPAKEAIRGVVAHFEENGLVDSGQVVRMDGGGRKASSLQSSLKNAAGRLRRELGYDVDVSTRAGEVYVTVNSLDRGDSSDDE